MPKMTDAQLAKWGERYGITADDARLLRRVIDRYAKQQTHVYNGDPHRRNPDPADKARNAELWDRQSEQTAEKLMTLADLLGFDDVDFGVGLYPALAKGRETYIMVPDC